LGIRYLNDLQELFLNWRKSSTHSL
jgi:hypothetical protein